MKRFASLALALVFLFSLALPVAAFTSDNYQVSEEYYIQDGALNFVDGATWYMDEFPVMYQKVDDETCRVGTFNQISRAAVLNSLNEKGVTPYNSFIWLMYSAAFGRIAGDTLELPPKGTTMTITLDFSKDLAALGGFVPAPDTFALLHGKVSEYITITPSDIAPEETKWTWERIPYTVNGNTITFTVDSLSPFAFARIDDNVNKLPFNDYSPDGGNTNPDGGNTNPDGGNTNPDGGNNNPDGGNTPPTIPVDPNSPNVPVNPNPNDPDGGNTNPDDNTDRVPGSIPYAPTPNPNAPSFEQSNSTPAVNDANPNTGVAFTVLPVLALAVAGGVTALASRKKK